MPILQEIMQAKETATFDELSEKINVVGEKISSLKYELVQSLNSSFVLSEVDIDRVTSWHVEVSGVYQKTQNLAAELSKEKMAYAVSVEELDNVREQLDESMNNIAILKDIVEIVHNLENAEISVDFFMASSRLRKAFDGLQRIKSLFETGNLEEQSEEEDQNNKESFLWMKSLRSEIIAQMGVNYEKVLNEWNKIFKFERNKLTIELKNIDSIGKIVDALKNLDFFDRVWDKFTLQIWNELFNKACNPEYCLQINRPSSNCLNVTRATAMSSSSSPNFGDISLLKQEAEDFPVRDTDQQGFSDKNESINENYSTSSLIIFFNKLENPISKVNLVFQNIIEIFLELRDIFITKNETLFELWDIISPRLFHKLSGSFLNSIILQNSNGDIEQVKDDIKEIHNFINTIQSELHFTIPLNNPFVEFEKNYESLFIEQVRSDLLSKVRKLIKEDPHLVHVAINGNFEEVDNLNDVTLLHKNPFQTQDFSISKSISEMVTLLESHIISYPFDDDIVEHAYNIYLSIVTIPNKDEDEMVPLTAVIMHNDCWYLNYHASVTFPNCEDKISLLRSKAAQAYSYMLRNIRTKVNSLISVAMSDAQEAESRKDKKDSYSNKFLQISAEFLRLAEIFENILPYNIWRKTLATLVDHTLNEICSKVLSWEDISETTADELAASLTEFAIAASLLFKPKNSSDSQEMLEALTSKMCSKWQRFRLLIVVLTASMKEIEEKWVSGCGPLSIHFTPEEVRKLVRALFQNTDRRASFLATIK